MPIKELVPGTGEDGIILPVFDKGGAVYNVKAFGAKGDGVVDDTAALQDWVDEALSHANGTKGVVMLGSSPGSSYRVTAPINFGTSPKHLILDLRGSAFIAEHDDILFDLNSTADPTATESTLGYHVTVLGGRIHNNAATKTASEAFRAFSFRRLAFEGTRITGFWTGIDFAAKDTINFRDLWLYNNTRSLVLSEWSPSTLDAGGVTLSTRLEDCHFSINGQEAGLLVEGKFANLFVYGGNFNGNATNPILIDNGGVAGGVNHRPFCIALRDVHLEQGGAGIPYVKLRNDAGKSFYSFVSDNCSYGGADANGIDLEGVHGAEVRGGYFAMTAAGGGMPITLDADCKDFSFGGAFTNRGTQPVISYACSRDEITVKPEMRRLGPTPLTGHIGHSFSSGTATLDMSSLIGSAFPSEIVPKGYWLQVQVRDSDSAAAATQIGVRFAKDSTEYATLNKRVVVSCAGHPNDEYAGQTVFVPCDENGDIYVDYAASGVDTLDVHLAVSGIAM